MKNRKAAEDFILKYIKKIAGKINNVEIYTNLFANMNDKQFDQFMNELETGEKFLPILLPNFKDTGISVENNISIGAELGYNFFQKLWIEGNGDIPTYLTPIPNLVVTLPLKKASQTSAKKRSIPPNNKVMDSMTGQPTGDSKGAKMSYPETQLCSAMGLHDTAVELVKYRGGDLKGNIALNGIISKYGSADQNVLNNYASGVESTHTLKTFLTAAHIKATL